MTQTCLDLFVCMQLGTPSAPIGTVTVAFLYIVGATTLLTEIPDEARKALALCYAVVTEVSWWVQDEQVMHRHPWPTECRQACLVE